MLLTTGVRPLEVMKLSKHGITVDGVSMRTPSGPDWSRNDLFENGIDRLVGRSGFTSSELLMKTSGSLLTATTWPGFLVWTTLSPQVELWACKMYSSSSFSARSCCTSFSKSSFFPFHNLTSIVKLLIKSSRRWRHLAAACLFRSRLMISSWRSA